MDNNWNNREISKCNICKETFKCHTLNIGRNIIFCPYCGSKDLDNCEIEYGDLKVDNKILITLTIGVSHMLKFIQIKNNKLYGLSEFGEKRIYLKDILKIHKLSD